VAYNFQTGNNNIKLLTEYESVTQKVLLLLESILQNPKQLQHARLFWRVRYPRFWIRPTSSCDVLGLPLLFGAEHCQSLDTALTNVR
jgi:hypothetical protein